jgi:sulfate adenylyltransferase subunit 1
LQLEEDGVFDLYADNRSTGSFVLIDPDTLNTVAGGMVVENEAQPQPAKSRSDEAKETVTLTLPLDLAQELVRHDVLADRLNEVEVLETNRRRLGPEAQL